MLLPKELIEACGLGSEATVTVQDKTLIVSSTARAPRDGWAAAARQMRERGDDLTPELQEWQQASDPWDTAEWQWPDTPASEKV